MKILIVDDNLSLTKGLATFLRQEGHGSQCAGTARDALTLIDRISFDLIITDLKLPDMEGMEVIRKARSLAEPPEVILMTAFGSIETAVEAMKLGAIDYLTKPVPMEEFAFRIDRISKIRQTSLNVQKLERANKNLLEDSGLISPLDEIVGTSPEIAKVKELIKKTAPFPSTILLMGETGTGKEMAARAIHSLSPWASGPFVRVNCASIPASLFEAELFGHEKGAFTDAHERRIGKFESAKSGTLFLDEVGEVPLTLQSKLLRALQEKEITRVGSSQPIIIETRIIAATNRPLEQMAIEGLFREDLLYRLAVIKIAIPALRERRSDIPAIAQRLLDRLRKEFGKGNLVFAPETLSCLSNRNWRGNVRELKNAVERAVVLSESAQLLPTLFSDTKIEVPTTSCATSDIVPELGLIATLEMVERDLINKAMTKSGGVKSRAAEELRIPRTNLLYRLKKLGIDDSE